MEGRYIFFIMKYKIILMTCLMFISLLGLTGCSNIDELLPGYSSEVTKRLVLNTNELEKIHKAGIIDDNTYNKMADAIAKNSSGFGLDVASVKDISADNASEVKEAVKNIKKNLDKYIVYCNGVKDLTNNITNVGKDMDSKVTNGYLLVNSDNSGTAEIEKIMQREIYVLKTYNGDGSGATFKDLNVISNSLQLKTSDGGMTIDDRAANTYFVNSSRRLLDTTKKENHLVQTTKSPSTKASKVYGTKTDKDEIRVNELGKDFLLTKIEKNDDGKTVTNAIQVRLNEFNPDAVDKLVGKDGVPDNIYVMSGNKCYLMQYPVFYVSGFKTTDGKNFTAEYKMSDLQVNIATKSTYFRDGSKIMTTGVDRYHVTSTQGESSFVVDNVQRYGVQSNASIKAEQIDTKSKTQEEAVAEAKGYYSNYICNYGVIPTGKEAECKTNIAKFGSIVLRDYLEYTYMPNVVTGENIVAVGRMFRLSCFNGKVDSTSTGEIGRFIGKDNIIQGSTATKTTGKTSTVGSTNGGSVSSSSSSSSSSDSNSNSTGTQSTETSGTKDGSSLTVAALSQVGKLGTGCETVSLTMALNYNGIQADMYDIADNYLPKGEVGSTDPSQAFVGNPRDNKSYGCYSPVITKTANSYLSAKGSSLKATDISGSELESLFSYIDKGKPVIVWGTQDCKQGSYTVSWTVNGKQIQWYSPEHCMLLVGYNTKNSKVSVCDPLKGSKVEYDLNTFKERYNALKKQAVVIQ